MQRPVRNTMAETGDGTEKRSNHGQVLPRERRSMRVWWPGFLTGWDSWWSVYLRLRVWLTPLRPAGHLPHRWGDWQDANTLPYMRRSKWPRAIHIRSPHLWGRCRQAEGGELAPAVAMCRHHHQHPKKSTPPIPDLFKPAKFRTISTPTEQNARPPAKPMFQAITGHQNSLLSQRDLPLQGVSTLTFRAVPKTGRAVQGVTT